MSLKTFLPLPDQMEDESLQRAQVSPAELIDDRIHTFHHFFLVLQSWTKQHGKLKLQKNYPRSHKSIENMVMSDIVAIPVARRNSS